MQKRSKILLISAIGVVLALTLEAVVINITAPMPSGQIVSKIEENPSFKAETANATYTYLGYDNGRSSPIGPCAVSLFSPIASFIHIFWPPPSYSTVTFIFMVYVNSTSVSNFPYPYGILLVQANPDTGQVYGMNATGICA